MSFAKKWLTCVALFGCAAIAAAVTPPQPAAKPAAAAAKPAAPAATPGGVRELDWDALLPQDARSKFQGGAPPPIHDYLGGESGMAAQQVLDFSVNKALDGNTVKIPGFIVPLDVGKDGLVSEFFLVPYFGACIHVPPPPPNQVIYVKTTKGVPITGFFDAMTVTGVISRIQMETDLADVGYRINADKVVPYEY